MENKHHSPEWIRDRIARIPRVEIALKPTPLHAMSMLERSLGGPRIFIKRDDLTGVALGGNKLRNLEFRLAHALKEKPDTVIVGLDLQSNSARQTVGACNKLGLRTHLVLVGQKPQNIQGNLLCDYVLGADVHFVADAQEQAARIEQLMQECKARGERPHNLSANPMFDIGSALAYIETTLEIQEQLQALGTAPTDIYMSSSGKGQAGIVLARRLTGNGFRMHGITATSEFHVPSRTVAIANDTARLLQLDLEITEDEIDNDGRFVGARYGVPSDASVEAVRLFARTEGILLDPIYTGKAAAGMISHIREGRYGPDDVLVFVHTGGAPALFTWNESFLA
ncbi:MAG: pyridoxal-phosphate dependent enzyme [Burkholderiaceae bacterium]